MCNTQDLYNQIIYIDVYCLYKCCYQQSRLERSYAHFKYQQNDQHFAENIFNGFFDGNYSPLIQIQQIFVPKVQIKSALVQVMA